MPFEARLCAALVGRIREACVTCFWSRAAGCPPGAIPLTDELQMLWRSARGRQIRPADYVLDAVQEDRAHRLKDHLLIMRVEQPHGEAATTGEAAKRSRERDGGKSGSVIRRNWNWPNCISTVSCHSGIADRVRSGAEPHPNSDFTQADVLTLRTLSSVSLLMDRSVTK